jgi:N-acetylglucosamine-6-phosphate deacetylase
MDEDIYVEVIADMSHVHPQSLKMLFDMKSADKILLISDSIKGPGWGSGPIRGAGGVLLGSGIPLAEAVKNLILHGVPQERALQFASINPMQYLGIKDIKQALTSKS